MNYSYTPERTFFFPHNGNFIENTILSNYKNDGKKFHKSFNNHNITYNLTSSYNYDNKTPLISKEKIIIKAHVFVFVIKMKDLFVYLNIIIIKIHVLQNIIKQFHAKIMIIYLNIMLTYYLK